MKDKDIKKHDSNPDPITGEPGAHPLGVAGGGSGGALAGAAIGGVVGGPIGAAVGGVIGAVTGGLAGKGAAEAVNPTEEEGYWRTNYKTRPYHQKDREFDHYAPAYRYGWEAASKPVYNGRRFDEIERDLGANWNKARGTSKNEWNDMKSATRDAFERVQTRMTPGMTQASEKADAVWEQTKGNWHQIKGAVKAKWNDLTDDEIDQMKGERERIVGKIQEKYGEAKWREADIAREFRGFKR
ncbi:MAG: CsbD family protein [Thermoanaerobaculia bacterium]|nr:CsbD family protein [Thermoanaerobaculia bacterium]